MVYKEDKNSVVVTAVQLIRFYKDEKGKIRFYVIHDAGSGNKVNEFYEFENLLRGD